MLYEIRKNLLEYDEVMDEQRKRVYSYRQKILDGENCWESYPDYGDPFLHHLYERLIGEDIEEILKSDLQLATDVRGRLQEAVAFCESAQDYVSRDLLESILEEEEEHIDWLESQLWLIENSGLQNYTQSMV